jgi:hypothetical protein
MVFYRRGGLMRQPARATARIRLEANSGGCWLRGPDGVALTDGQRRVVDRRLWWQG